MLKFICRVLRAAGGAAPQPASREHRPEAGRAAAIVSDVVSVVFGLVETEGEASSFRMCWKRVDYTGGPKRRRLAPLRHASAWEASSVLAEAKGSGPSPPSHPQGGASSE